LFSFYPFAGDERKAQSHKAKRVLVVGLGKDKLERESFRKCGGHIAAFLKKGTTQAMMLVMPQYPDITGAEMAASLVEGLILGSYQFKKYKKSQEEENGSEFPDSVLVSANHSAAIKKALQIGAISASAACVARDMANEPGNQWTSEQFAKFSLQISKKYNFKRKVLGLKEIVRLKMGGIIGVNQGSEIPPKLIMLEYRTGKKVPTLLLVGKGLTFDSGGISLKPSDGMQDMKYDMCGGAAVLGAMEAIGRLRPENLDVVAMVPATDNMPGAGALKPGDVIELYNGKSVEIISTDAEGRLILADALAYGIEKYKPDAVIDLATLTGSVIIGLGHHRTGLMSNNEALSQHIMNAGEISGEPLWRLPLGKEYRKQIDSKVADLKNVGGREGGSITAAEFLQEFVAETPWAHLDIAGTAWNFTEKSYVPKGPSGTGVRTILQIVNTWKKTTLKE
jgi:leucyl aminopeptidase